VDTPPRKLRSRPSSIDRTRGRARPLRKRRRWLIVLGSIIAAIGVIFGALGLSESSQTTHPDVPAGSAYVLKPTALTAVTATISWSGAAAKSTIYLVTGAPSCASPKDVAASRTGVSGHITAMLHKGTSYSLYACSSTSFEALDFKVTTSGGVTTGDVVAIVLLVLGVPLIALGVRGRLIDPYDEE
jgi:hypothetical protein